MSYQQKLDYVYSAVLSKKEANLVWIDLHYDESGVLYDVNSQLCSYGDIPAEDYQRLQELSDVNVQGRIASYKLYSKEHKAGRTYEVFYVICLDAQHNVIYPALVHEGTIDQAPFYPRIIVETALRHNAHSVILAHNHPGGSPTPSPQDIEVTKRIQIALEPISISVLDHIIAAGQTYVSCSEKGLF